VNILRDLLKSNKVLVIGHRGAFYDAPENTMLSFRKAVELGADMIELDVRMCKSGEIVVIHDADVRRTSDGEGLVRDLTLNELKKLDFGEGEKIPTLEEVLEFAKRKVYLNIELKEPDIVEKVVKLVEKYDMVNHVVVSSFYHNALLEVKEINPDILTAPLFMHRPVSATSLVRETKSNGLHPFIEFVDEGVVKEAKRNGYFVNVWTVDYPEDMEKLINMGVTGIITNDVSTARQIVNKLKRQ